MMHDKIAEETQALLDQVARKCLRAIVTQNLDEEQVRRLAKFCFGCMNQKHELPRRLEEHGYRAISQVLQFVDAALAALKEPTEGV
jgi:hypothetical protein